MAATPAQVRAAIASYLAAHITGLRVTADTETIVTVPAAVILPSQGPYLEYEQSMVPEFAAWTGHFRVVVLVSKGDVRESTPVLDGFLSPEGASSIVAALAADTTVGGVADYVHAVDATWLGLVSWAGVEYQAGQINLEAAAE